MNKQQVQLFALSSIPVLLAIITLVGYLVVVVQYTPDDPVYALRDHWDITYDGVTYPDMSIADIPDITPQTLHKHEVIRIERVLTMDDVPSPTLSLITYHLATEIYLDDALIESCAMEEYESGGFAGGNRYYINLPADFTGKKLTLYYHMAEENMTPFIYTLYLGSFHDLVWTFLNEYGYVLVIGVFLCLFGGFFLIFALIFVIVMPEIGGQRISSVICILTGIWILTHYRVFALFTGYRHTMTLEYFSFYMVLPLLYAIIIQVGKPTKVFRFFAALTGILVLCSYVLHFTGIAHMHRFRNFYFGMCSLYLFLLLFECYRLIRSRNFTTLSLLQLGGPAFFCTMIFVAMLVYLLSGGDTTEYTDFSVVLLTTGPLVFAISRFIIYIRLLVEMAPHKLEFSSLNALAYVDALTGLNNRTLMSELFERLDQTNTDYCLISLDLNGLKLVNDTQGHAAGDRLIKDFAETLRSVFPEEAEKMRIGGDEFLVAWRYASETEIEHSLKELDKQFSSLDAGDHNVIHSVSYGYAFRHEIENATSHRVFLEADNRMYANKRAFHENMPLTGSA